MGAGMVLMPALGDAEHLLHAVIPDLVASRLDSADTILHGHAVPGLAHTKAINNAPGEAVDHLFRWQDNNVHIAFRIDPAGAQPVAEQQGMTGESVRRCQGNLPVARIKVVLECGGGAAGTAAAATRGGGDGS